MFSSKCVSQARMTGKTAIVTGCNTGIGKFTVKELYRRGAKVIMACRNVEKAEEAMKDIEEECRGQNDLGQLRTVKLDLSSLQSVRSCASQLNESESTIDLLINNAGVMMCPLTRTEEGFEMQLGTNHLGHFLFTLLLLPKIVESRPARIVNLSSSGHKQGRMVFDDLNWQNRRYSALGAYGQSKLANILFTKELARRLVEAKVDGVTTYSLHPGVISTDLGRHLTSPIYQVAKFCMKTIGFWYVKNIEQGSQTTLHCALDEEAAKESGLYYDDCKPVNPSRAAENPEDAQRLWKESLELVGLDENYNPFKTQQ